MSGTTVLQPGPITGDQLAAIWPRLCPHVVAAIAGQPDDVRALMTTWLQTIEQSPVTFEYCDDAAVIAVAFLGVEIARLPLAMLADNGSTAH